MKSLEHEGPRTRSRDADTRGQAARRECLGCGRLFHSAHLGNRRCKRCAKGIGEDGPSLFDLDVALHSRVG